MTAPLHDGQSRSEANAVREQLSRILASVTFQQSQRRQRFLQYLVDETLAGRGDRLKGYSIAVEVFGRPANFDPLVDPLVRVEAARLRDKLREYYDTEGRTDPVRIELPKGSYAPRIEDRRQPASTTQAEAAEPIASTPLSPASLLEVREWALRLLARASGRPALGLIGLAAFLVAAGALWAGIGWSSRSPTPQLPSIAVLPFENIGREARWDRFSDGITEDIITDLSHSRDLLVIARSSTAIYRDKPADVRSIGHDLNVKYILEGSIQPSGDRVRVTAQLIEAASGGHVWSERYDRRVDDLFNIQNEITQTIAATLVGYQGAVAEAERRLLRRKPPASLTAYETYLLGIEAKHRVTKESLAEAESLLNKAIDLDPQLARAYVGLVDVQFYLIDLGLAPSFELAVTKMEDAAEKAVMLDPEDGKTHLALGMANLYRGRPEQAATEFARAEALGSSDADLLICVAWSIPALGQTAHAVTLAERSLRLNPHYPDWYNQGLSYVFFFGRQFDRSIEHRLLVKKPLAIDYAYLAMAYAHLGRTSEAKAAAVTVGKLHPAWNAEIYLSEAGGYAKSEAELFVEGARKAGLSDCVPPTRLSDKHALVRVGSCDQVRALAQK